MYRNCKCKKCHALNSNAFNNCVLEDACDNVTNVMYDNSNDCGCGFDEEDVFPSNPLLAQSYVPWQTMDKTFTPCVGLRMGTIFPELVSPYMPGQGMEFIRFVEETNKIKEGCNKC